METERIRARVEITIPRNLLEPLLDDETPALAAKALLTGVLLTGALADFNIRIAYLVLNKDDLRNATARRAENSKDA